MSSHPNVISVTDSNFDSEVLKSTAPVLVDFWAEWCGPCKMLAPVLDEIAAEKNGTFKIAKINVDESRELATRFGIRNIPTLLFFKNGSVQDQVQGGGASKRDLVSKLEALA